MLADRTRARMIAEIRGWLKDGANDFATVTERFERAHPELAESVTTLELAGLIEEALAGGESVG